MRQAVAIAVGAALVAACGSSISPALSPSPSAAAPTEIATTAPVTSSPLVTTGHAAVPSAVATATATDTPFVFDPLAGWTKPRLDDKDAACTSAVAVIDSASHYHVAASCGSQIQYFIAAATGSQDATMFAVPSGRIDQAPQIAADGTTVYVAYSEIMPLEGCGGGADTQVGVFYRSRNLSGAWSAATRLGPAGDGLDSFRVVSGTLYATVYDQGGDRFLETSAAGVVHRYSFPGQNSSLRVGSDGRARLVYQTSGPIGYGVFNGSGVTTSSIPSPSPLLDSSQFDPLLVLDGADHAHVLWTIEPTGGCALPEGSTQDGTWYATNASGSWQISRLTIDAGSTSLTLNTKTGDLYALVDGDGLGYFSTEQNGNWNRVTLVAQQQNSPVIRLDPATGDLLVVFAGSPDGIAPQGIYTMTRPPLDF